MTLTELLLELGRRGVALERVEDELKLEAPRGALTPELLAELRVHKPALLERLGGPRPAAVEVIPRTGPIPLSSAQARMWFLKRLEVELGRFSVPIAARVLGPFDSEAFAASLDVLVARHEILRTRYELREGVAVQIIDAAIDPGSPLVGYRASLNKRYESTEYFRTVADPRTRAQIGFGGWGLDFPSAEGFIRPLLSCAAYVPTSPEASFNLPGFCDRSIDAQMDRAAATQVHDPAEAIRLWQRVEDAILAQAPIIPAFNRTYVTLVTARVGNYQHNPQWGVLLSQLWVK